MLLFSPWALGLHRCIWTGLVVDALRAWRRPLIIVCGVVVELKRFIFEICDHGSFITWSFFIDCLPIEGDIYLWGRGKGCNFVTPNIEQKICILEGTFTSWPIIYEHCAFQMSKTSILPREWTKPRPLYQANPQYGVLRPPKQTCATCGAWDQMQGDSINLGSGSLLSWMVQPGVWYSSWLDVNSSSPSSTL